MSKQIKLGLFSALIVVILAFPVFGFKLTVSGISLKVESGTPFEFGIVAAAAIAIFLWQLVRDRVSALWSRNSLPSVPKSVSNFLTLSSTQRWIIMALVVVALVWPFFATRSSVDLATLILIYVMLGLGLNIVVGFAGLLDLGYVGFYAVGAYSYALLAHYFGLGFWICLPLAGIITAIFGYLLGFPVLRLRGDYLAIVTLGFGEIIRLLLRNMTDITGGPNGISIANEFKPTLPMLSTENGLSIVNLSFERRVPEGIETFHHFFGMSFNAANKDIFIYLIALLLVLVTLFLVNRLLRMPIGRAWEALREDEIACRALGLNPTIIKLSAFTIGASLAGFAGCFFAARQGLITPESFTFIESAMILAIVVLGGMGSQLGVILAAIVLVLLQEWRELSEYRMLIFGLLMILMMIWRPQGLLPMQRPHLELKSK